MVTPAQIQALTNTAPSSTGASTSALGKDDFLKLLVQELKFQDPLNPMSGSDYAAQLAQFSSVEQLSNINSALQQSITANGQLSQSINNALAATFIGKQVKATGSTFDFSGGAVELGYSLAAPASSAQVSVIDSSGTIVRTLTAANVDEGDSTLSWDGKDDRGQTVAPGKYTFTVQATDENGGVLQSSQYILGVVDGVRYKTDGTYFVIGDVEVPLSDILEITGG